MSDINIITPPDFLHNKNFSVFLFYPSLYVKEQFQEIISKSKNRFNVYMYEEQLMEVQVLGFCRTRMAMGRKHIFLLEQLHL